MLPDKNAEDRLLAVMAVLAALLASFHFADDIVRGFERGQLWNFNGIFVLGAWLAGPLMLARRRSGYIIVLLLSILGLGIPYLHMRGRGVGLEGRIAHTEGAFFFVWTLLALGVTSLYSIILSARGLWRLRAGQQT